MFTKKSQFAKWCEAEWVRMLSRMAEPQVGGRLYAFGVFSKGPQTRRLAESLYIARVTSCTDLSDRDAFENFMMFTDSAKRAADEIKQHARSLGLSLSDIKFSEKLQGLYN